MQFLVNVLALLYNAGDLAETLPVPPGSSTTASGIPETCSLGDVNWMQLLLGVHSVFIASLNSDLLK